MPEAGRCPGSSSPLFSGNEPELSTNPEFHCHTSFEGCPESQPQIGREHDSAAFRRTVPDIPRAGSWAEKQVVLSIFCVNCGQFVIVQIDELDSCFVMGAVIHPVHICKQVVGIDYFFSCSVIQTYSETLIGIDQAGGQPSGKCVCLHCQQGYGKDDAYPGFHGRFGFIHEVKNYSLIFFQNDINSQDRV